MAITTVVLITTNQQIFQYLLWKNADPMLTTRHGWTVVHLVAIKGFVAGLQTLIDHDVALSGQDRRGLSPGHLAALHGNTSCLSKLLLAGAVSGLSIYEPLTSKRAVNVSFIFS